MFQLLELPAETEKLETYQLLLITKRKILLQSIYNSSSSLDIVDNATLFHQVRIATAQILFCTSIHFLQFQEVSEALTEYEEVCSEASSAGVDLVSKDFTNNWDYIQSCFFALTILTTIGQF